MYRILVVDDEAKIRLLIRKYAEFEGHEVTEAENGMEAVRLVELRELPVIVGSNAAGRNFYDECAKDPA